MDLSIVILNWNSGHHLKKNIPKIIDDTNLCGFSIEIFIVDNGSSDNSRFIIKRLIEKFGRIIIPIYLPENRGTTYSRNLALRRAIGKYVAILDSDAYPRRGCFRKLVDKIESSSKRIGIIVPRLEYPNGWYQKSVDVFPTLQQKIYRLLFLKSMENKGSIPPEGPVDYAISAFWLFKKELLEKVGYLDEAFFYAPEDVDFCLNVWQAGYLVYYYPEATAVHDAQELTRSVRLSRMQWIHVKGLIYLFFKHRYIIRKPTFS